MRVLVTGANRGIGLEFVRQYAAAGHVVEATCRRPAESAELCQVAGSRPGVTVRPLDVTDDRSIKDLSESIEGGIDLLINNAGRYGPPSSAPDDVDADEWSQMLAVNTLGPLRVTAALLPALRRAARPRVVGLSSIKASIGRNHMGASYPYRATKAGLNAVLRTLAVDLAADGICVVAISPGWIRLGDNFGRGLSFDDRMRRARRYISEFGGSAARVTLQQSVTDMIATIDRLTLAQSGSFLDHTGAPLPW